MDAKRTLAAAVQSVVFIGASVSLFGFFFCAMAYAPLFVPMQIANVLGASGYFAVLAALSAFVIGAGVRIPFGKLFPEGTSLWAFKCSLIAAIGYLGLALIALGLSAWPLVDAVLFVSVFTTVVGIKRGAKHVIAI